MSEENREEKNNDNPAYGDDDIYNKHQKNVSTQGTDDKFEKEDKVLEKFTQEDKNSRSVEAGSELLPFNIEYDDSVDELYTQEIDESEANRLVSDGCGAINNCMDFSGINIVPNTIDERADAPALRFCVKIAYNEPEARFYVCDYQFMNIPHSKRELIASEKDPLLKSDNENGHVHGSWDLRPRSITLGGRSTAKGFSPEDLGYSTKKGYRGKVKTCPVINLKDVHTQVAQTGEAHKNFITSEKSGDSLELGDDVCSVYAYLTRENYPVYKDIKTKQDRDYVPLKNTNLPPKISFYEACAATKDLSEIALWDTDLFQSLKGFGFDAENTPRNIGTPALEMLKEYGSKKIAAFIRVKETYSQLGLLNNEYDITDTLQKHKSNIEKNTTKILESDLYKEYCMEERVEFYKKLNEHLKEEAEQGKSNALTAFKSISLTDRILEIERQKDFCDKYTVINNSLIKDKELKKEPESKGEEEDILEDKYKNIIKDKYNFEEKTFQVFCKSDFFKKTYSLKQKKDELIKDSDILIQIDKSKQSLEEKYGLPVIKFYGSKENLVEQLSKTVDIIKEKSLYKNEDVKSYMDCLASSIPVILSSHKEVDDLLKRDVSPYTKLRNIAVHKPVLDALREIKNDSGLDTSILSDRQSVLDCYNKNRAELLRLKNSFSNELESVREIMLAARKDEELGSDVKSKARVALQKDLPEKEEPQIKKELLQLDMKQALLRLAKNNVQKESKELLSPNTERDFTYIKSGIEQMMDLEKKERVLKKQLDVSSYRTKEETLSKVMLFDNKLKILNFMEHNSDLFKSLKDDKELSLEEKKSFAKDIISTNLGTTAREMELLENSFFFDSDDFEEHVCSVEKSYKEKEFLFIQTLTKTDDTSLNRRVNLLEDVQKKLHSPEECTKVLNIVDSCILKIKDDDNYNGSVSVLTELQKTLKNHIVENKTVLESDRVRFYKGFLFEMNEVVAKTTALLSGVKENLGTVQDKLIKNLEKANSVMGEESVQEKSCLANALYKNRNKCAGLFKNAKKEDAIALVDVANSYNTVLRAYNSLPEADAIKKLKDFVDNDQLKNIAHKSIIQETKTALCAIEEKTKEVIDNSSSLLSNVLDKVKYVTPTQLRDIKQDYKLFCDTTSLRVRDAFYSAARIDPQINISPLHEHVLYEKQSQWEETAKTQVEQHIQKLYELSDKTSELGYSHFDKPLNTKITDKAFFSHDRLQDRWYVQDIKQRVQENLSQVRAEIDGYLQTGDAKSEQERTQLLVKKARLEKIAAEGKCERNIEPKQISGYGNGLNKQDYTFDEAFYTEKFLQEKVLKDIKAGDVELFAKSKGEEVSLDMYANKHTQLSAAMDVLDLKFKEKDQASFDAVLEKINKIENTLDSDVYKGSDSLVEQLKKETAFCFDKIRASLYLNNADSCLSSLDRELAYLNKVRPVDFSIAKEKYISEDTLQKEFVTPVIESLKESYQIMKTSEACAKEAIEKLGKGFEGPLDDKDYFLLKNYVDGAKKHNNAADVLHEKKSAVRLDTEPMDVYECKIDTSLAQAILDSDKYKDYENTRNEENSFKVFHDRRGGLDV